MFKLDFSVRTVSLVILALCKHYSSADEILCAFSTALSATIARKLAEVIPAVKFFGGEVAESFSFYPPGPSNPIGKLSCDSATNELKEIKEFNLQLSKPLTDNTWLGRALVQLKVRLVVENGGKSLKLFHSSNEWFSTSDNCVGIRETKKKQKCMGNLSILETEIADHEAFFSKLNDMLKTQKWDEVVNAFKFLDTTAVGSKVSKNADLAVAAINGKANSLPYADMNFKSQLKNAVFDRFHAANGKTFELKSKNIVGFQVKVEITGKDVAASEDSAISGVTDFDIRIRQFVQPVLQ